MDYDTIYREARSEAHELSDAKLKADIARMIRHKARLRREGNFPGWATLDEILTAFQDEAESRTHPEVVGDPD
jgi:hypothetical protein